jgi:integrase
MAPSTLLPISERPLPDDPAWLHETPFLLEAGANSLRTETTYRSGLRLFADWLQHFNRAGYSLDDAWPLRPDGLSTAVILNYRNWLLANRARSTTTTYMSAVLGYLTYLDGQDQLPAAVQLGKLQRQMGAARWIAIRLNRSLTWTRRGRPCPALCNITPICPCPRENDTYNRRLSLLRDRALVQTLYSTAARISEVVALNRTNVNQGRASHAPLWARATSRAPSTFGRMPSKRFRPTWPSAPTAIRPSLWPTAATPAMPAFRLRRSIRW